MKIGIYNLEPKYTNLALEKIKMYHRSKGDEVEDYFILSTKYDKIYCSSIFTFTPKKYITSKMICGGSGFDFKMVDKKLKQISNSTLPPEIEAMKPKLNIGFTSRGCNRKCPPCIVWKKEGKFKIVGNIYDIWDGVAEIISILDNNILFNKKHFIMICNQAIKENLKITFSQGLDLRLIDKDICTILNKIKHHKQIKFAFDNYKDKKIIINKLKKAFRFIKPSNIMVYVLCGYDTSFNQDMERAEILKSLKVDPFIMLYHKENKLLNEFARWNNRFYFRNLPFKDYLRSRNYSHLLKDSK